MGLVVGFRWPTLQFSLFPYYTLHTLLLLHYVSCTLRTLYLYCHYYLPVAKPNVNFNLARSFGAACPSLGTLAYLCAFRVSYLDGAVPGKTSGVSR